MRVLIALFLLMSSTAQAETYILIIQGLAGEAHYQEQFNTWSEQFINHAVETGLPSDRIVHLRPDTSPRSDQEGIQQVLDDFSRQLTEQDQLWLILFGHGSTRQQQAYFNIPSSDLAAGQLAQWLQPITARLIIVNTSSASGGFVKPLSAPNRVLISATRSGSERYFAHFGSYWVTAFDPQKSGDLDKDDRVSLLESFQYARREVERYYQQERRLRTEHAILDDNGDGQGSQEANKTNSDDGAMAARIFLLDSQDLAAQNPARARLLERQDSIVQDLQIWISKKAELPEQEYYDQLEILLVELTQVDRSLRANE